MAEVITEVPLPANNHFWTGVLTNLGMLGRNLPAGVRTMECRGIHSNSFYHNPDRKLQPGIFEICQQSDGRVIAAGGCVLAAAENINPYTYHNDVDTLNKFKASDLDLYIRANSAAEAQDTIRRVLEYANPIGDVVRTKYALSFYCAIGRCLSVSGWDCITTTTVAHPGVELIKVQVIDRVIPYTASITDDIGQLFETYDLDCCKWACDGEHFYTTERAKDAYRSRICHVPWSKLTDSSLTRMARYYKRCYDFEIEGYDSRQLIFPLAIQKIAEIIAAGKDPTGLPSSSYAKVGEFSDVGGNPMLKMFKSYGKFGAQPYMICGIREDAMHMVMNGTQPDPYMFDWCFETMNKMAETVLWLVSQNKEEDRVRTRGYCVETIDEWKRIMATVRFPPMFSAAQPNFTGLTTVVYEKYWMTMERIANPLFVL